MQISATLVKGKARVQFGANKVRGGDWLDHKEAEEASGLVAWAVG